MKKQKTVTSRNERVSRPLAQALDGRSAGVLLHLTSLPGPHGLGDMGVEARKFADFLQLAGQRWWQMLPVNPAGAGNSPYSGASAFAGNPLLISLESLVKDGLLDKRDILFSLPNGRASYARSSALRKQALRRAFQRFTRKHAKLALQLERFRTTSRAWLADYALFMALSEAQPGRRWTEWPSGLARREPNALSRTRRELADELSYFEFEQFIFARQWQKLREYCRERAIGLIGDAPIFIAHDSAEVWASARYFRLNRRGEPTHVAGVPPDYFSKTGQLWGNPLYRWKALEQDGFSWWIDRFRTLLERFDLVRLDHFIGFSRYWAVPAREKTAKNGRWVSGPGRDLFDAARKALRGTPFIAEDLGQVTADVRALRDAFELPGMRVLQFAFGGDAQTNEFLPHNYIPNAVAYTGTHDNDTFRAWLDDAGGGSTPRSARQASRERREAIAYLAGPDAKSLPAAHWAAIRAIYASVARAAIVPMQDILGLGSEGRMNTPGMAQGSWQWRLRGDELTQSLAGRLRGFVTTYGRAPSL